jgi:hypothetical protein
MGWRKDQKPKTQREREKALTVSVLFLLAFLEEYESDWWASRMLYVVYKLLAENR